MQEITLKRICLSPHQTERETETLGLEILRGVTKVHVEGLLIRALWCIVIDMTESLRDVVVKSCTFKRTACALLLQQSSANWLRNFFLSGSKKPKETPDPVLPHRILISQNDIIGDNQSGGVGVALATNGWTKDDRVYISNNRIRQCTSGVRLGCWRKNRNLKSEPEPDLTAELTEAKALGFPEGKVIIAQNRLKCAIVVAMSFYSTIALLDNEIEVTNEEAIFSMGTNCAGTLTGNKITVRGSVLFGAMASQVFLYSKNKEKIHRENEITEEEIASPDVLEAIRDGVCTFVKTGPDFQAQYWWNCATCDWPNGSGVCAVCKDICHKGHKLTTMQQGFLFQGSPANFCRFYCDCGSRFCDDTISCLALRSRKK
eukprot:TRINITY_DN4641_c0_g1_i2.p1 TRINITY_DN4641_c0_g1~~TRINITY_DN4641_c0_g1_i2.p1  ORF type:complete len:373 (-),score=34.41 TRINITY_DN4641_c0_g1_i2:199-1317(-)